MHILFGKGSYSHNYCSLAPHFTTWLYLPGIVLILEYKFRIRCRTTEKLILIIWFALRCFKGEKLTVRGITVHMRDLIISDSLILWFWRETGKTPLDQGLWINIFSAPNQFSIPAVILYSFIWLLNIWKFLFYEECLIPKPNYLDKIIHLFSTIHLNISTVSQL